MPNGLAEKVGGPVKMASLQSAHTGQERDSLHRLFKLPGSSLAGKKLVPLTESFGEIATEKSQPPQERACQRRRSAAAILGRPSKSAAHCLSISAQKMGTR